MEYNGLPLYDISIDIDSDEDGVKIMSIVDLPAVEKDFLKFSKEKINFSFDDDKRIVTGVALRANYPIYRKYEEREFYVRFTPEQIENIVYKFMREGRTTMVNLDHENETDGVYLFESFILNESHRLNFKEFDDIDNGSWMVSYKVENDDVWKNIKEGKLNGFSVEIEAEIKEKLSKENDIEIEELIEYYQLIND